MLVLGDLHRGLHGEGRRAGDTGGAVDGDLAGDAAGGDGHFELERSAEDGVRVDGEAVRGLLSSGDRLLEGNLAGGEGLLDLGRIGGNAGVVGLCGGGHVECEAADGGEECLGDHVLLQK